MPTSVNATAVPAVLAKVQDAWEPLREALQDALTEQDDLSETRKRVEHQLAEARVAMCNAASAEDFEKAAQLKLGVAEIQGRLDALFPRFQTARATVKAARDAANTFCFDGAALESALFDGYREATRALIVDPLTGESLTVDYVDEKERLDVELGDHQINCEAGYLKKWAESLNLLFATKKGRFVFD